VRVGQVSSLYSFLVGMVAWPHSTVPPPLVICLPRRFIVESFPLEVREKIDFFISEGFNPRSVFDWLSDNVYPKWREEGKSELCVTRRTIYNYMKNRCPENLLVSNLYLKEAKKRVDDDIDTMANLRENIANLKKLIDKYDLNGELSEKAIGTIRLLIMALNEVNLKYAELQIRLGLKDEKVKETPEDILEKLKREQEEKEKEALQKVVEP